MSNVTDTINEQVTLASEKAGQVASIAQDKLPSITSSTDSGHETKETGLDTKKAINDLADERASELQKQADKTTSTDGPVDEL